MSGVSASAVFTLSVVAMMFALGLGITLPCGVAVPGSRQGLRQFGNNLLRVVILVAGLLAALLILQCLVGYPGGL